MEKNELIEFALLDKHFLSHYDLAKTEKNVLKIMTEFLKAQYKYTGLLPPRMTSNYEIRYECLSECNFKDTLGNYISSKLDTEQKILDFYTTMASVITRMCMEERVYIKCNSNNAYESVKNFINQSSKYHKFVKYGDEIPRKKAFDTIFMKKENVVDEEVQESKSQRRNENYVEITGQVSHVGNEFIKKDGSKAQFIEIQQQYQYNDKVKYNKISVMLSKKLIDSITNIEEKDIISIKGKLNTYTDKDNNLKSVINCYEIEILENGKDKNNSKEIER